MTTSIKEVARHAGVSVGTVSNVLNRPDRVAEATRNRVLDAIEHLGFVRDLIPIFEDLTGQPAGRRVLDQEYGPFLDFVRAALQPFKATQGCEADIREALRLHKAA